MKAETRKQRERSARGPTFEQAAIEVADAFEGWRYSPAVGFSGDLLDALVKLAAQVAWARRQRTAAAKRKPTRRDSRESGRVKVPRRPERRG